MADRTVVVRGGGIRCRDRRGPVPELEDQFGKRFRPSRVGDENVVAVGDGASIGVYHVEPEGTRRGGLDPASTLTIRGPFTIAFEAR